MNEMIPSGDWDYPVCWAEYSRAQKREKAEELYGRFGVSAVDMCQDDFKIASLIAYGAAADYYRDVRHHDFNPDVLRRVSPFLLPVRYSGGDMCYGRVFAVNHCAFSSADSIIGFRDAENCWPQRHFKVLKGLKFIGCHENWVMFKLDRASTDDMTGMLYSPLEKNFTIEFAHFPHDASPRCVFRWLDC